MNKRLLFGSLLGVLSACQQEVGITPDATSLAAQVAGTYRTNFYLDPSCVAIPADQMPYAVLKPESDSSLTFIYTKLYPIKSSQSIEHIQISRQDGEIKLRLADLNVGLLKTDRVFTNNGMEKQGDLLRIALQNDGQSGLYFAGIRQ